MYSNQKGIIPAITGIISLVLPIWILFLDTKYIFNNINTRIPEIMGDSTKPLWVVVLLYYSTTMFFPVFFGLFFANLFPSIEIRNDGIRFSYWEFFGYKVLWDEIESLVYYPNGYVVLQVNKRGIPLFNGLYFNALIARFFRSYLPVIIMSPGLRKRNEIISEILSKCSPRVVHRRD
jgi:hypothetical protein